MQVVLREPLVKGVVKLEMIYAQDAALSNKVEQ